MHMRALRDSAEAAERSLVTPTIANISLLLQQLFALEARLQERARRLLPPSGLAACRPGCSYCCYQNVAVSPPELLAVALHLRTALTAEEMSRLATRVAALASQLGNAGNRERFLLRKPCPLLREGRCLVYPVRPLACRGDNSLDAEVCSAAFLNAEGGGETVPVEYPPQRAITSGLLWGAVDALDEAGLEAGPLELTRALAVALAREDAAEAWLRGERVFQSATWPAE